MGHGGTLDPLATGVLVLGVGKGTKSLQNFLGCTKTYEAVVLFGASTDTYDRVGRIIKKGRYDEITEPMVEKALESFRGKFKQMPPLYSALKMEGKPLYEYAREGRPIPREIETRDVNVLELDLVEWYEPGTHDHRWPAVEAQETEKNFATSVWRVAKRQALSEEEPQKLTPDQEEQETKALAEWETNKRKAEARVDGLVYDEGHSPKRRKMNRPAPMMSGALGELPPTPSRKGANLLPPEAAPNTPPPWDGKGPPAAKIRMTVTSGFYVRSLCHDLGEKLQCGAMMAELCRSRQGEFILGSRNCLEYDDLAKGEEVWGPKVEEMLGLWMNKGSGPPAAEGVSESPGSQKVAGRKSPSPEGRKEGASPSSPKKQQVEEPAAVAEQPAVTNSSEKAEIKQEEGGVVQGQPAQPVPEESPNTDTVNGTAEEEWNGIDDVEPSTEDLQKEVTAKEA